MNSRSRTVLFAANRGYALTSSRIPLIQSFIDSGWTVVVATGDDEDSRALGRLGVTVVPVNVRQGGLSFRADSQFAWEMMRIVREYRPTLIQNFHFKPLVMCTAAARASRNSSLGRVVVCNAVTGIGRSLSRGALLTGAAAAGYRLAGHWADATIFQNRDDMALFIERGWVKRESAHLIIGSGVDLSRFVETAPRMDSAETRTVVMLARLVRQKGVEDFVAVAEAIGATDKEVRFIIAGEAEKSSKDSIDPAWLHARKSVEFLGRVKDVPGLLKSTDIFLFPSYYREGVPRVVMEAAAAGVPCVAYDVPGVREAIIDGKTGFLVPVRDRQKLGGRVQQLLGDPEQRRKMGEEARHMAEQKFDVLKIRDQYLAVYKSMGIDID